MTSLRLMAKFTTVLSEEIYLEQQRLFSVVQGSIIILTGSGIGLEYGDSSQAK